MEATPKTAIYLPCSWLTRRSSSVHATVLQIARHGWRPLNLQHSLLSGFVDVPRPRPNPAMIQPVPRPRGELHGIRAMSIKGRVRLHGCTCQNQSTSWKKSKLTTARMGLAFLTNKQLLKHVKRCSKIHNRGFQPVPEDGECDLRPALKGRMKVDLRPAPNVRMVSTTGFDSGLVS